MSPKLLRRPQTGPLLDKVLMVCDTLLYWQADRAETCALCHSRYDIATELVSKQGGLRELEDDPEELTRLIAQFARPVSSQSTCIAISSRSPVGHVRR